MVLASDTRQGDELRVVAAEIFTLEPAQGGLVEYHHAIDGVQKKEAVSPVYR